jgi:hypothetical protein
MPLPQEVSADLYAKLPHTVAPLFYDDRSAWLHMIALRRNQRSFLNTHRMVRSVRARV